MSNDNSNKVDKIVRRRHNMNANGGCDRCPPHRKENQSRRVPRDDRYKNHR